MNSIEEINKQRFQFLYRLYELSDANDLTTFDKFTIGEELGFSRDLTGKICRYLDAEGLVRFWSDQGAISISHQGIVEVEQALSNPQAATDHFLPANIIFVGHMTHSQIQQSSPGASQVEGINEAQLAELEQVMQSLEESIEKLGVNAENIMNLRAGIQTIEAQMTSSKPSPTTIRECLRSIRAILESATGSAIASSFVGRIPPFLAGGQ